MGMTMTQKILAAHAGLPSVEAGQLIEPQRAGSSGGITRPGGLKYPQLQAQLPPMASEHANLPHNLRL